MSKAQSNIDNSFKQKFENFSPTPPEHIWEGVKAGITPVVPSFFGQYWKGLTIAAVATGLVLTGIFFLKPGIERSVVKSDQISVNKENDITDNDKLKPENEENINPKESIEETINPKVKENENVSVADISTEKTTPEIISDNKIEAETISKNSKEGQIKTNVTSNKNYGYTATKHDEIAINDNLKSNLFAEQKSDEKIISEKNNFELTKINNINIDLNRNITPQFITPPINDQVALNNEELFKKKGAWSVGLFLSPEVILNNYDSVEILNNYSLGVEPSYYFNNHLFIRFGLNASYSGDRGFAHLDYRSYDLLGSYDYVYDVTFDSIDGKVVPTYHTYEMEVWDTVRHLEINAITNNYIYIQTPLLLGYYKNTNNFKWYFYGGPAFNFMVSKQIDQPLEGKDYIELLNLHKELPERSPYYFQLWFGAGVEFKAGKNLGIAFEPNYRYYLNNVFKEQPYNKSGLSGLSIRFGLTYTIQ